MAQRILSEGAMRAVLIRARIVPIAATLVASATALIPVLLPVPVLPPFGLMMLLAWRLLRPELWPAWAGLLFGLFDDLISGQPIGSAMALWAILLIALDFVDHHLVWRDFWIDWLIGGIALVLAMLFASAVSGIGAAALPVWILLPQLLIGLLLFPMVMRLVAALDRWRLPSRSAA